MREPFHELFIKIIGPALITTLKMVVLTTILSSVLGFVLSVILVITKKEGLSPNKIIYSSLDIIINIIRSFPFVILIISIIPVTRFIAGTSIGSKAAIVPLTIATTPFIARLFESSLNSVDTSILEAAKSFGASDLQIVFKVMVKESIPSLINNITIAIIAVLGSTAMAGAVGAGGLGSVALTHGYQNFNDTIMYTTVIILIFLVQSIQFIGNKIYESSK